MPFSPESLPKLVDPYDQSQDLTARVRSYLHSNCSQCHVEAGGGNAAMELEFTKSLDEMKIIDVRPQHDTFGIKDWPIIAPGHPEALGDAAPHQPSRQGAHACHWRRGIVDLAAVEMWQELDFEVAQGKYPEGAK